MLGAEFSKYGSDVASGSEYGPAYSFASLGDIGARGAAGYGSSTALSSHGELGATGIALVGGLGASVSSANSIGTLDRVIARAVGKIVTVLAIDIAALVAGVVLGGPLGIVTGLYKIGDGVRHGNLDRVAEGALEAISAPARYGLSGGFRGSHQKSIGAPDANYQIHDLGCQAGCTAWANTQLIEANWSRHDFGAYGQVHRLLSTATFALDNVRRGF